MINKINQNNKGEKTVKDLLKAIDKLPFIVKIILCIPALDIIWAIYRIMKGLTEKNTVLTVIGILCIVPGAFFIWIVDMITTVLNGKPFLT